MGVNHSQLHATTPVDACRDMNTVNVQSPLRCPRSGACGSNHLNVLGRPRFSSGGGLSLSGYRNTKVAAQKCRLRKGINGHGKVFPTVDQAAVTLTDG
jgi:hypothetical protein